ncbi:MAG: histidine triad nucleotide-binding protein [Candidatus Melainabacteria bacterium]|nr:histidine triad nucleotide-binding protein [Candidatus Melainabacteria bacterium]
MGLETNTRQPDLNCIFCKIVKGEIPSKFLLETQDVVAFNDISPQAPTHVLIIPREHVKDISKLSESAADRALLGTLFQQAAELALKLKLENGFRLVVNTGDEGGQTVHHLHLHLIGGRQMIWPPG